MWNFGGLHRLLERFRRPCPPVCWDMGPDQEMFFLFDRQRPMKEDTHTLSAFLPFAAASERGWGELPSRASVRRRREPPQKMSALAPTRIQTSPPLLHRHCTRWSSGPTRTTAPVHRRSRRDSLKNHEKVGVEKEKRERMQGEGKVK